MGQVGIEPTVFHTSRFYRPLHSPQAIYKWQNGAALPTVDNLIVLAALLHVHIDDILVVDQSPAMHTDPYGSASRVRTGNFQLERLAA